MVEVVIVLAVVGAIVGAAGLKARPANAVRSANAIRAFLLWGRLEALWLGSAVAVVPGGAGPGARVLIARVGPDARTACDGEAIRGLDLDARARVHVVQPLRSGIVWLPAGDARSCAGGGVISGRMIVADAVQRAAVVVSSLGRVRVEVVR